MKNKTEDKLTIQIDSLKSEINSLKATNRSITFILVIFVVIPGINRIFETGKLWEAVLITILIFTFWYLFKNSHKTK